MDNMNQHINSYNKKTHSYDQMRKIIVNLVINKNSEKNDSYPKLTHLQNILLMIIVDTYGND